MPYTIQIRPINLGNTFPAPLAISGSLANNPGAVLETVTAVATGFGPDLIFVSAATPPRGSGTAYIGNSRNSGDLCRSGVVFSWPASPVTSEVITIPPASTTFTTASFGTMTRGAVGRTLSIPTWGTVLGGALTGLVLAPTGITINGMSVTPTSPNLVVVTVAGTLSFLQFFFPTSTTFTATIMLTVAPSGDVVDKSRIFSISVLASGLNPGVITPGMNLVLSILAPIVAQFAAGELEKFVNSEIDKEARKAVSKVDATASISPAAAICAHLVTITPGTLAVEMVLSNPLGPALVRPTANSSGQLAVSVTPAPVEGSSRNYTVHVTDAATGGGVDGANVEIATFSSGGTPQSFRGITVSATAQLTATLRFKRIRVGGGTGTTEYLTPTLTVSKAGFATAVQELLFR